jgi:hypothetical protein
MISMILQYLQRWTCIPKDGLKEGKNDSDISGETTHRRLRLQAGKGRAAGPQTR